jgi:2-keto-4-pentenoate hydratase
LFVWKIMAKILDALIDARLNQKPIPLYGDAKKPTTLEEGYALQEHLHAALQEEGFGEIVGHKIGCTTPVMQEYLGIPHPCAGGIFSSKMYERSVELNLRDFINVGIECEIGVFLADDLDSRNQYTRENVAHHVASCCSSIEIVDDRYVDYEALGTPTTVADDFFNAAVVIGDPVHDWQDIDLGAIKGGILVNGIEAGAGTGDMILGHPFEALAWLANMKAQNQAPLLKGQFVTLGSVVKTVWIDQPDTLVEIKFEKLGGCRVRFNP